MAPNPDKQWILRVTDKMKPIHRQFTDLLMTKRLQTLQSVDMAVERVYQELKAPGELDNTYLVYTSDHHGTTVRPGQRQEPFEFDIRVPFLARPGIEPGTVVDDIVLNIDLAPTFLEMAGWPPRTWTGVRCCLCCSLDAGASTISGLTHSSLKEQAEARLRAQKYSRAANENSAQASSNSADAEDDSDDDDFLDDEDERRRRWTVAPAPASHCSATSQPHTEANVERALDPTQIIYTNSTDQSPEARVASGKAARLAAECSKAELRAPARPAGSGSVSWTALAAPQNTR
ncbi:Extracellular sulfatase SULF-1 homolog [Eumeta japonica]|uniref:Extracellular sulfatase SULF-1 homolog n=1 Tax=Eumeta variegata TaxID=151549 RepID=A0A4C2A2E3_EUMVA|nr:Extracellular sulfatase SULF-1 homolog [Eumeta japonica]